MCPRALILLAAALTLAVRVQAEEVAVPCSRDNTLYEDGEGNIGNGSGQHLFVGKILRGPVRRALLAFDLTGYIPTGATITAVRLSLTVSKTQGGPQMHLLHRMLGPWGEGPTDANEPEGQGIEVEDGDATWIHAAYPDQPWTAPGGDFAATASGALEIDGGGSHTGESTPALVADVQGWLDAPEHNFGWVLIGNEVTPKTAKRFFAREHDEENRRPILHVMYERGGATAVAAASWGSIKAE